MSNRMPDVRTNLDLRSPDRLRTGPHRMDPTAVLRMMLRCQRTLNPAAADLWRPGPAGRRFKYD
jgi:hypothetical protein